MASRYRQSVAFGAFDEQVDAVFASLSSLSSSFDDIRSRSESLRTLHPNAFSTPRLALDLRDVVLETAVRLRRIDEGLTVLRDEVGALRLAAAVDSGAVKVKDVEGKWEEVDALMRRFVRRVREVKQEAKEERRGRRRGGAERKEPYRLSDYLQEGVCDFSHLLPRDLIPAARWVVENPFSVLANRHLEMLTTLQRFASSSASSTHLTPPSPLTLFPPSSASTFSPSFLPPYNYPFHTPSDPTPAGLSSSKPLPEWKREALGTAAREQAHSNCSRRFFDDVARDGEKGWQRLQMDTGRPGREKWIICLTLAFFPCLLLLGLVETWLSSPAPSSSSTFFSPIFHSGGDLALVTVEPTRMADSTATAVSRSGFDETGRLRERRRKSVEEDGRVV